MSRRKYTFLIVDDYPDNLFALERALECFDCMIFKASSGKQALELLLKHDFDLIIMDIRMPGMDGFETVKLIREKKSTSNIPVIFLSGAESEEISNFQSQGYSQIDYILKPIDIDLLEIKIEELMINEDKKRNCYKS